MPVVRNLLWNRPRKMRRWDRSSSVELLWSHYVRGILLWSGQRKLRSLLRSKTVHTRWDRSSSVELLWSRLRKMRGWLRSKIEKGIDQLPLQWPASCPTVFWSPCPYFAKRKKIKSFEVPAPGNFPYTICKSRKLKSWPCLQFFLTKFAIMKEKKSLPQQICHRKRNDWNFCPGNFRKICLKATTCGQNVMFDVSFSFKTSKVWLCFACCLPFKNMCFHNPAPGVLLIKKMPLKKYSCLSLQFFPCGICHNWKDSRKSLLRTVADKICQWKKWIPCPGNFYGKFAIEQKMCSRNLPQHCPQKTWKWKNFPFHAEFSLEKNINQIVINKIHAGCHCAVRQITEDIAQRNRHNKLKKLYYPKSIYIYKEADFPLFFCKGSTKIEKLRALCLPEYRLWTIYTSIIAPAMQAVLP